jgi:hypothetical protein
VGGRFVTELINLLHTPVPEVLITSQGSLAKHCDTAPARAVRALRSLLTIVKSRQDRMQAWEPA